MNRILSLQFYLVSSGSAAPWPGPFPCNCETLITAMATQTPFPKGCLSSLHNTEYLTWWQICQFPLSSEGSKLFSFTGGGFAPTAPRPHWGLCLQTPLQPPWPRHWFEITISDDVASDKRPPTLAIFKFNPVSDCVYSKEHQSGEWIETVTIAFFGAYFRL